MLETCTYEDMMVDLVKRITQSDVHEKLKVKLRTVKKGYSAKNKLCMCCHTSIVDSSYETTKSVIVFQ
jgi:hypothetical protein